MVGNLLVNYVKRKEKTETKMKNQGSSKQFTSTFKEIIRSIIPFGDMLLIRVHDDEKHQTMYSLQRIPISRNRTR